MMNGSMPHGSMMGGAGGVGWMWLFMLFCVLGLASLVALFWLFLRRFDKQADGVALLKQRLATGEISDEEYKQKLGLLKQ